MIKAGKLRLGVITDVHHRDDIASEYWNIIMSDAHWRQYSTDRCCNPPDTGVRYFIG